MSGTMSDPVFLIGDMPISFPALLVAGFVLVLIVRPSGLLGKTA